MARNDVVFHSFLQITQVYGFYDECLRKWVTFVGKLLVNLFTACCKVEAMPFWEALVVASKNWYLFDFFKASCFKVMK